MLDGLLLGDTIDRVETLVGHIGAVRLESIDLRDVALQEDFQRTHVHETGRVGNDAGKEPVILLVTLETGLVVSVASDQDWIQTLDVTEQIHVGIEAELPLAVLHLGGNDDGERQIQLAVPFRDVAETGGHLGGVQGFGGHHGAGGFVLDGLHQQEFATFVILDTKRVAHGLRLLDLRHIHVLSQDQGGRRVAVLDGGKLPLRAAGSNQSEGRERCQGPYENKLPFHLENINKAE